MIPSLLELERRGLFERPNEEPSTEPSFLPIRLGGGIGDAIISIDTLLGLSENYEIIVYTPHKEALEYFYPGKLNIFKDMHRYTWHLEVDTIARFHKGSSFKGFLNPIHEELFNLQQEAFRTNKGLEKVVEFHPNKSYLAYLYGKENGFDRRTLALHSLGINVNLPFTEKTKAQHSNYITIHDGFDIQNKMIVKGRCTKTWDIDYWAELVSLINKEFPELKVYQLGKPETSRPVPGAISMIGKLNITEAFDFLSKARVHIDGDSGIVHAARRLNVPSVVIWGPTPKSLYGYAENVNLRSSVCGGEPCYWLKRDWMNECYLGLPNPHCMDSISASQVMTAVENLINRDLD